jgi:hypothetical protein
MTRLEKSHNNGRLLFEERDCVGRRERGKGAGEVGVGARLGDWKPRDVGGSEQPVKSPRLAKCYLSLVQIWVLSCVFA